MKEMVGGCCVCSDERGWPDNPLVYCDGNGCTVAVHQACYGIVSVPTGPWYCRKCECPETNGKVRCELCPSKSGALKRSDTGGWAHVVCALYIPEVRFGNVTSMEPIVLRLIPPERYNKTCYICQESGKNHRAIAGACMQCNKAGCKQQFHVTCAQSLGLLCEEAGNYLDNVKYCGYCQHHYSKLKKGGNVKTIPPYKPVSHDSQSSDSSGEKEASESSPKTGNSTPTHSGKAKGSGRKSGNTGSGKSTPNSAKTPTHTTQNTEVANSEEMETSAITRKAKSRDKNKSKKNSPARRSSSASDVAPATVAGGSKGSTPAPSPQHTQSTDPTPQNSNNKGGSTPSKVPPPVASPVNKLLEFAGVISSVASATASLAANASNTSSVVTTSVVQSAGTVKPAPYQESVITNIDCVEIKQTKKRKAITQANANNTAEYTPPVSAANESLGAPVNVWGSNSLTSDVPMDGDDQIANKKAKTDFTEPPPVSQHYNPSPLPVPTHSPTQQSQRQFLSPMPGPSGLNQPSNIRSPSQPQGKGGEREWPVSLLVSVPLPKSVHHLDLTHSQIPSISNDHIGPSHIFHHLQKQATLEQTVTSHAHQVPAPGRTTWGGLNVSYEMQQTDKSGLNNHPGIPKDLVPTPVPVTGGGNMMRKKRAAMASLANSTSVPMSNTAVTIQSAINSHNLSNMRRPPQPTPPPPPPPPIYQETIKDSPPSSPSSDLPLKPKMENKLGNSCSAPHMLGNELNPDSGVAARLQEQLNAEMIAHAAGATGNSQMVPPPLINKASQGITGGSSRSSSGTQSLDQLLERQWEQGSQFLMEQAQHFDIASLLSCLHQLRTENVRLEDHVGSLLQRRDHLLAVNARLAIPLTTVSTCPPPPPEPSRCPRENGSQMRAPPGPVRPDNMPMPSDRPHQMMVRDVQQKPS